MASVINKTTYRYIASANTPDYPEEYWVHNPDVSALVGNEISQLYWKVAADGTAYIVIEMSDLEKADVDALQPVPPPIMADGRPLVRSDTRPLNTETYFTGAGDSTGIGDGICLTWDFTDSTSNIYTGPGIKKGYKAKEILMTFQCPVHLKDGTIYFFDAPWGAYIQMDVVIPAGGYYPNKAGMIPAAALGLPGSDMYAQASVNTSYQVYVNHHHMYGSCPMGDELNAEGAAINAVPPGWIVRGLIFTPLSDNISKGFGMLEMYRCHTQILPGETLAMLHA